MGRRDGTLFEIKPHPASWVSKNFKQMGGLGYGLCKSGCAAIQHQHECSFQTVFLQRLRIDWPCSSSVLRTGQGWIVERSSSALYKFIQQINTNDMINATNAIQSQAQQMRPPFQPPCLQGEGCHAFRKLSYSDCFTRRDGGFRSALPKILSTQPNSKIRLQFSSIIYTFPPSGRFIFQSITKSSTEQKFWTTPISRTLILQDALKILHFNPCVIYAPEHFMNNFMHIPRTDDPPIDPAGPSFFLSPYKSS